VSRTITGLLNPGACNQADYIALQEAGLEFDRIRVDLETKRAGGAAGRAAGTAARRAGLNASGLPD
jgi:hypothetical protein